MTFCKPCRSIPGSLSRNCEATEATVSADGKEFRVVVRLETPREREYVRHGGILPYVLRRLAD